MLLINRRINMYDILFGVRCEQVCILIDESTMVRRDDSKATETYKEND